jgi:hypothetical protein
MRTAGSGSTTDNSVSLASNGAHGAPYDLRTLRLLSYVMIAACRHCVFKLLGCAMRTAGSRSTTGKFGEYCFKWCAWRTLRFTHATLATSMKGVMVPALQLKDDLQEELMDYE